MKTKLTTIMLLLFAICITAHAQAPLGVPYQAVARDNSGNLISNQNISVRFSIHNGAAAGPVVYSETHSVSTNALGLFTLNVGQGTPVSGTMAGVNWSSGTKFLQVEMDPAGGSSYVNMGTTQMMSVPYALHAGSAANFNETDPQVSSSTTNIIAKWNGTTLVDGAIYDNGNIGIGTTTPSVLLEVNGKASLGGPNNSITGGTSVAVGMDNTVSGFGSFAAGRSNTATANHTTALGYQNQATTDQAVALGWQNISSGLGAFSVGRSNIASGNYSTAIGFDNDATGIGAFAIGNMAKSIHDGSFVWADNVASPFTSTATNQFLIRAGGGVGIGTIAPTQQLDVNGQIRIRGGAPAVGKILTSGADGTATWETPAVQAEVDPQVSSANTNQIPKWSGSTLMDGIITDNGTNIGIGTTTPSQKLDVNGNAIVRGPVFSAFGDIASIYLGDADNRITNTYGTGLQLVSYPGSTSSVTVRSGSGNVGVKTDNPSTDFDVNGQVRIRGGSPGTGKVLTSSANGTATWETPVIAAETDPQVSSSSSNYIPKWNGSSLVDGTIYDNGNIGIGISSPGSRLHVNGDISMSNVTDRLFLGSGAFWSNSKFTSFTPPTGNWSAGYFETNSGNGSLPTVRIVNQTSGLALEILNGSAAKPGGGSWIGVSDRRLKKDIESFNYGLKELLQVNPVWYRYNGVEGLSDKVKHVGVIAQELQPIAPHMIDKWSGKEGEADYLSVDPSDFTYMIINAVKELSEENKALKAEINELRKLIAK